MARSRLSEDELREQMREQALSDSGAILRDVRLLRAYLDADTMRAMPAVGLEVPDNRTATRILMLQAAHLGRTDLVSAFQPIEMSNEDRFYGVSPAAHSIAMCGMTGTTYCTVPYKTIMPLVLPKAAPKAAGSDHGK
jgi:hypothetical protein